MAGVLSIVFGLLSALTWGSGDFCGGLASKRANPTSVVMVAEFVGAALLVGLAVVFGEAFPSPGAALWAVATGLVGLVGLLALYQGLASGHMGIVAPLSAVVAGIVPIVAGVFAHGVPDTAQIAGFLLALAAVWLLAGTGELRANPREIGLALTAGLGFGLYFVLAAVATRDGVFWNLALARVVAGAALVGILLVRRQPLLPPRNALPLASLAGTFDAGGNLFFALAAQAGRIDVAGILASLYPGATVFLAWLLLGERLTRPQAVGVAAALVAVVLIAV
jgi:drug/metabolite transporter (DMT)-like permease